jgi:tetraacyldisaccharide 4'-kinase
MIRLAEHWYGKSFLVLLLLPLAWLFCALAIVRRQAYQWGLLKVHRFAVPVIVVGNISVGGTGKTPLVTWLVNLLKEQGYRPGIVSRGYGGGARHWPQQVRPDSDPQMVGDEAVLLSRRCACPMAVGPDRAAAVSALLAHTDCNIIVSDDGLQHYALGRDVEIAVVDGVRRFGNGHCLPAGPLREPQRRLRTVDLVVANGVAGPREYLMKLQAGSAWNLRDPQRRCGLEVWRGKTVHAVAGIGYPQRFFQQLAQQGLEVIEHPFPDHHPFARADILFADDLPVLMTEKDAVKCLAFAAEQHWCLPVDAQLDERAIQLLLRMIGKYHG